MGLMGVAFLAGVCQKGRMNETKHSEHLDPVEVPPEALSAEILDGLVEEFVLREGTDYGAQEITLDVKKNQIMRQLESRQIKIIFDPNTESVILITAADFLRTHPG